MTTIKTTLNDIKKSLQQGGLPDALSRLQVFDVSTLSLGELKEVLYLKAVTQRLLAQTDKALVTLNELIHQVPDYGRAYQEKGYCLKVQGNSKDAAEAFYRATQYNPALMTSWQQLVPIYQQQHQEAALAIANEQLRYLQSLPRPILGGYDLMYEGELTTAEQVCRQFLQQNKHQPDAMMLLAEIGMQLKVYHDAEFLLESCVELYPDHYRAATLYLDLLMKVGQFDKACAHAKKMGAEALTNIAVSVNYANALVGIGDIEQAITLFTAILAKEPQRVGAWLAKGHALKAKGDIESAISAYRQAAKLQRDFGDAYWSLANTKTYRFSDDEIASMKQIEQDSSQGIDDKIHLQFALGKALEDAKAYDEAFAYYHKGNQLKLVTSGYDIGRTEQAMKAQKEACPQSIFGHLTSGYDAPDPIFIVGLPRAGSTLLEQILASHPDVDGTMELHNIMGLASRLSSVGKGYPLNLGELSDEQCRALGQQYIEQTRVYRQDAPYFIDKMPNNFIHIGLIKRILPNAKIIDARREAMACCFSGFKQLFGEGQEFTYGLEEIGRYYRAYLDLMAHWHQVLPKQILTVQHEDVIDDLEGQVRRMLDFCGLPFNRQCVNYHQTERLIKTPSSEQVRQPIFRTSMAQWQHFDTHLEPLKSALVLPTL